MVVRNDGSDTARVPVTSFVADTGVTQLRSTDQVGAVSGLHPNTAAHDLVESAHLPTTDGLLRHTPWFLPGEA
jgi:hypothetical protein